MEGLHISLFNILIWTFILKFSQEVNQMDPDFGLTSEELIKKYNYPFEKYTLQTEDGYFLEVHRIPNTKFKNRTKKVLPVLLFSGLFADSATWTALGPQRSLAFILADDGYDVWMGNNRGTTLCKKHITLDPYKDKKKFWDFSLQEMGYYDIPVTIDHILIITKQEKLLYIGYSQGSSSYFAMLSDKPNYNNKIKFAIALAPATSVRNTLSFPVKLLKLYLNRVMILMESLDIYELFPRSQQVIRAVVDNCTPNSSNQYICAQIACSMFAGSMEQLNITALPLILNNAPAGSSAKAGFHLLQLNDGIFRKFDHGNQENLKRYGQENPPIYNLSKAVVPTAIIYGSYDDLVSLKDVEELLAPKLPNVVEMKMIPKFNHFDLSLGMDAPRLVFPAILRFLKKYS